MRYYSRVHMHIDGLSPGIRGLWMKFARSAGISWWTLLPAHTFHNSVQYSVVRCVGDNIHIRTVRRHTHAPCQSARTLVHDTYGMPLNSCSPQPDSTGLHPGLPPAALLCQAEICHRGSRGGPGPGKRHGLTDRPYTTGGTNINVQHAVIALKVDQQFQFLSFGGRIPLFARPSARSDKSPAPLTLSRPFINTPSFSACASHQPASSGPSGW